MSRGTHDPQSAAVVRSTMVREVDTRARHLVILARVVLGACEELAAVASTLEVAGDREVSNLGAKLNELGAACRSFDGERIELVEATDAVLDAFGLRTRHIVP
jgi:hypothetical protein